MSPSVKINSLALFKKKIYIIIIFPKGALTRPLLGFVGPKVKFQAPKEYAYKLYKKIWALGA